MQFYIAKSYVEGHKPDIRVRKFRVVGKGGGDIDPLYVHYHEFDFIEDAQTLLNRIRESKIGVDHVEKSPHWENRRELPLHPVQPYE